MVKTRKSREIVSHSRLESPIIVLTIDKTLAYITNNFRCTQLAGISCPGLREHHYH